jgi:tetratricopeptide (TPR) repeat protein
MKAPSASGALLLVVLAAALVAAPPAFASYEDAMEEYNAGNYVAAAEAFQTIVDQSPAYDFGHYMLGLCLAKQRRTEEAIERLRIAVELNGERFEYKHALAQAHLQAAEPAEALRSLESVEHLVNAGNRFYFHSTRGYAYASLRRWSEAVPDLEIANGAVPGQKQVLDRLALSYFKLKRHDEAIPLLRRSLEIDPEADANYRILAEALMRVEPDEAHKKTAVDAAASYRARNPEDVGAADLLGRALLGAGRFEEAISAFGFVLDSEPGNCLARVNLALAMLADKRPQHAEQTLVASEDCKGSQPRILETLGMVHRTQGRYEEALATYERAYENHPTASARTAIGELRHNIEVLQHNEAVKEQEKLDLEYAQMLDKIQRWNRLTKDHANGLE